MPPHEMDIETARPEHGQHRRGAFLLVGILLFSFSIVLEEASLEGTKRFLVFWLRTEAVVRAIDFLAFDTLYGTPETTTTTATTVSDRQFEVRVVSLLLNAAVEFQSFRKLYQSARFILALMCFSVFSVVWFDNYLKHALHALRTREYWEYNDDDAVSRESGNENDWRRSIRGLRGANSRSGMLDGLFSASGAMRARRDEEAEMEEEEEGEEEDELPLPDELAFLQIQGSVIRRKMKSLVKMWIAKKLYATCSLRATSEESSRLELIRDRYIRGEDDENQTLIYLLGVAGSRGTRETQNVAKNIVLDPMSRRILRRAAALAERVAVKHIDQFVPPLPYNLDPDASLPKMLGVVGAFWATHEVFFLFTARLIRPTIPRLLLHTNLKILTRNVVMFYIVLRFLVTRFQMHALNSVEQRHHVPSASSSSSHRDFGSSSNVFPPAEPFSSSGQSTATTTETGSLPSRARSRSLGDLLLTRTGSVSSMVT